MMVSVAAVLFVKNEADDIGWWIAHHLAIGFTSLIIFDDHSTDGTWEILNHARSIHDIRLHRTDQSEPNFYWRQRNSYLAAIAEYRDAFDWLGFFDGDEYFYPVEDGTVGEFLAHFPDAHGVAVSWCIYGSGGHAFKPLNAPVEAYTTHSRPELPDNELIKSFIRPKVFGGSYIDPHRWNVDVTRYVAPTGKPVEWRGSGMAPQWDRAKVLHFVCRSMQHYLERIARRSDLYDSTAFWNHFDRNEVQDLRPLRLLSESKRINATIGQISLSDLHWQLRRGSDDPTGRALEPLGIRRVARQGTSRLTSAAPEMVATPPLLFAHVETYAGTRLFLDAASGWVRNAAPEAVPDDAVLWLAYTTPESPLPGHPPQARGILFAGTAMPDQSTGLPVAGSPVLLNWLPVELDMTEEGVTLRSPVSHHYFSAHPESGGVEANRGGVGEWERFRLADVAPSESIQAILRPYLALTADGPSLRALVAGIGRLEAPSHDALGCALAFLPPDEQKLLMRTFPGRIPSWLRNWIS
jgi:hypothetical protein